MTATICVHHWRIETPHGPTVEGECRNCGATRVFSTTCDEGPETFALKVTPLKARRNIYTTKVCEKCGDTITGRAPWLIHQRMHEKAMPGAEIPEGMTLREAVLQEMREKYPDGRLPYGVPSEIGRRFGISGHYTQRLARDFKAGLS